MARVERALLDIDAFRWETVAAQMEMAFMDSSPGAKPQNGS